MKGQYDCQGQLIKSLTIFSSFSLTGVVDSYRSYLPCYKSTQATLWPDISEKVTQREPEAGVTPWIRPSGDSRSANQCQASLLQLHKPALPSQAIKGPWSTDPHPCVHQTGTLWGDLWADNSWSLLVSAQVLMKQQSALTCPSTFSIGRQLPRRLSLDTSKVLSPGAHLPNLKYHASALMRAVCPPD